MTFDPRCLYLTHFSRVEGVQRLGHQLLAMLDSVVAIGQAQRDAPDRHAVLKRELSQFYAVSLRAHGVEPMPEKLDLLAMDIELNAQGLGLWLDRDRDRDRDHGPKTA